MSTTLRSIAKSALYLCMVPVLALGASTASADAIRPEAGFTANTLPANDDDSTDAITLPFELCFFGQRFNSLFVNNNGNVTFRDRLEVFTPFFPGSNNIPIIAPFFADVDTRGDGNGTVTYGVSTVMEDGAPHQAFGVNWSDVGYFPAQTNKRNTFQLVLIDMGGGDFNAEFNYRSIEWETGGASGGVNGLGGSSALVGYSNGAGTSFSYPGSLVNGAFINGGPNELRSVMLNNDGANGQPIAGRIEFECRNCVVVGPNAIPEPATLALLGVGLGAIAAGRRRRSIAPEPV